MQLETDLRARAHNACEICGASDDLAPYAVAPFEDEDPAHHALLCATCRTQLDNPEQVDPNHWRALNDSMWSEVPAVQVLAYRMLYRLRGEGWPAALLDMLYLDEATLTWARTGIAAGGESAVVHTDSNGNVLEDGDTVTLTKDLKVKGANFTAKRGTAVRGIRLVPDNPGQIEGKVDGQQIVLLTEFLKKSK